MCIYFGALEIRLSLNPTCHLKIFYSICLISLEISFQRFVQWETLAFLFLKIEPKNLSGLSKCVLNNFRKLGKHVSVCRAIWKRLMLCLITCSRRTISKKKFWSSLKKNSLFIKKKSFQNFPCSCTTSQLINISSFRLEMLKEALFSLVKRTKKIKDLVNRVYVPLEQ